MSGVLDYFYTMLQVVHGRIVQNRVDGAKDRGATAVEYGLLVGLIAVVIIAAVTLLGARLKTLFQSIVVSLGG
jgi:pilus assembly protein Flp/PilA